MCLLFESIKVENRKFLNLEAHLERMKKSVNQLWNIQASFTAMQLSTPATLGPEVHKCRITYNQHIQSVDFEVYHKRIIRQVLLVKDNGIDYSLKYFDRRVFDKIKSDHPDYDDFIIVKNNNITDSTFSNLVFYNGIEWHTPSTFLLQGTKRTSLLAHNLVKEKNIYFSDIVNYQSVSFINALLDPGDIEIPIQNIDLGCFR